MISRCFRFAFICLAILSLQIFAQTNSEIRQILPGQTLERELIGEETHRYQFKLKEYEFFQVQIEQKGVDVALKLIDSKSAVLATMDSPNEDKETETLSFVAVSSGNYILEISGFDKESAKGNYSIRRETSRTATDDDKKRVAIEKTFVEGLRLRDVEGQKEAAISKLEEALKGWQELKDTYLDNLTAKQIEQLKSIQEVAQMEEVDKGELKIEETIEHQIKGGQIHYYTKELAEGQVLQIDIIEEGVDIRIGILGSIDDNIIGRGDYGLGHGRETLTALIEKTDKYNIIVVAPETSLNGSYKINSILKNIPTQIENKRIQAEQLLTEGLSLQNNGTKQSLKNAIEKYEYSIRIWEDLGEKYWSAYARNLLAVVLSSLGEKLKALESYEKAHSIYQLIKEPDGEVEVLNNMGKVYSDLWKNDKALDVSIQAWKLATQTSNKRGSATALNNIGKIYSDLGDKYKALEYYNQALPIFKEIKNETGEVFLLNNIGGIYGDLYKTEDSLFYLNQALLKSKQIQNADGAATSLNNIGSVYSQRGEKRQAIDYFIQAMEIYRLSENQFGEAFSLNNLGRVYSDLGEKRIALNYLNQALEIRNSIKDQKNSINTLNSIGEVVFDLGETVKATKLLDQALTIAREIEDKNGEALTLNNLGKFYIDLGENKTALEYLNKALNIRQNLKNKLAEAVTLTNIGVVYSESGENDKALSYLNQALSLVKAANDKNGEANLYLSFGAIASDLGEKQKALDYYDKALSIFRNIEDKYGEITALNSMAEIHIFRRDKEKALKLLEEGLLVSRKYEDKIGEARLLNSFGGLYYDFEEKRRAMDYFNQSRLLMERVGITAGEAIALSNIGLVSFDLGEKLTAVESFNKSLRLLTKKGSLKEQATTLVNLMVLWDRFGNKNLAILYGKQGINIFQELRYFIENSPKGTQRVFLKSIEDTYRLLAELLFAEKRDAEGVQILEMLKKEEVFSFRSASDNQPQNLNQLSTPSPNETAYLDKIKKYFSEISPSSDLAGLRQLQDQGIELTSEQKEELARLTIEVEKMEKEFALTMQGFASEFSKSPVSGRIPDIDLQVQKDLVGYGKDTAFIYTLVGEERYRVILITKNSLESQSFDITREDLNEKIEIFRSDLQNKEVNPSDIGQELYEILINKPIGKELKQLKAKTLLWSLDGKLRLIPVATLWTGEKYFGQEYRNVNITISDRTPLNKFVSREWNVLGAGTSETQNVTLPNQRSKQFDGLKYVGSELMAIVKENGTENGFLAGKRLYNTDFTATALNKQLDGKYKVIHFASHFALNPGNMEDSYLILGDGNILTVKDIRDEKKIGTLNSELLVLSACETGVTGKDSNGIEIEGFAYIAQEQGADAILSSLWKVADESTSLFMKEFYRMRKANPAATKAEIIQQIQEKMMNGEIKGSDSPKRTGDEKKGDETTKPALSKRFNYDPEKPYKHPYFWAPFVLTGNWR